MKTRITLVLLVVFSLSGFAQKPSWTLLKGHKGESFIPAERMPQSFLAYQTDYSVLENYLKNAPEQFNGKNSDVIAQFPDENGKMLDYKIYKTNILHPDLGKEAADYIRTYVGISVDNPSVQATITTSIFGLHVGISRPGTSSLVIQPYSKDHQTYAVFSKKALDPISFNCDVKDVVEQPQKDKQLRIDDQVLRKYRIAISCTAEYSQYHINRAINAGTLPANATDDQKKNAVLAAITVTIARVNSVYIKDFGVLLEIVPNEKNIIFLNSATDPYNNNNQNQMLNANQGVVDNHIGNANYDVGHLFTTFPGGGVSGLGVVCNNSYKAYSLTGLANPVGDAYDIDYVAHEVGHEFGCSHTFSNPCGGQRTNSHAIEPGSGSTIMAYAGVCAPNVQWHSNDYFSIASILDAKNLVQSTGCAQIVNTGNHTPVVNVTSYANARIPKSTPFILKASANDQDGDALTYCWEQYDGVTGNVQMPPVATNAQGPLFRSLSPTAKKYRIFPKMNYVLNGTYGYDWERLPSVARAMTFTVTVRDNHVGGGQSPAAVLSFQIDANSGPFRVTSQTAATTWNVGSNQTITWNVAGTTNAPVNCSHVDIYFSTDGGQTFPHTLVANTPNDGSETFTVPVGINTNVGRFVVKAHNNYFFDANKANIRVVTPATVRASALENLNVWPNPAEDVVHITFNIKRDKQVNISLVDVSGREIFTSNYKAFSTKFSQTISTTHLSKGIYILKIKNAGVLTNKKLIIK